ncbi:penicillin-binding protein activator [Kushneria aurantia]|uniref:Penicillin-binding protein activator n=1 Tax=Kushneria aurantia TaxID=504092 RepID=A0ABV6G012_9GAMM|nr:penicillin-binding protein activator [Kushneria aurantia]
MRKGLKSLACVAIMVTLAGCAGTSGVIDSFNSGPTPDELLRQAQQQQGSTAANTRLEAANQLLQRGNSAEALQVAQRLDRSALSGDARVRWALITSQAALQQNDGATALEATSIVDGNMALSPDQRIVLQQRRGEALGLQNRPMEAAGTLIELQQRSDDPGLNDMIWRQLGHLDERQLSALAEQSTLAAGWVELARLQRRQGGSISTLSGAISQWQSNNPRHPASRRLPTDLSQLDQLRGQEISRIAVLLPSGGSLASIATAVRNGMQARAETLRQRGDNPPQMVMIDSQGQSMDSLYARATMAGAQAVVGPLEKAQVSELESRSEVPLPTLALNYGTNERNSAANLFQYGLSAEDEARQAAERARRDGHSRAAVMVPDNDWGSRVAGAFNNAFRQAGGDVVSMVNYTPSGSATEAVRRALRDGRGTPDMLFMLALPAYARQVPPTLEYYGAPDLPVYATSHVYEGTPQPRLDHDLDGVMFVDIPWAIPEAASGGVEALPFNTTRESLLSSDEQSPDMLKLEAMGVDAFELARRLPVMNAIGGFEMHGATGELAPRSDGRIVRILPWAQFRDGRPTLLSDGLLP